MDAKTSPVATSIAPSAINITPNYLQVGEKYCRTIFLATFPRFLHTNWFSSIVNFDRVFQASI